MINKNIFLLLLFVGSVSAYSSCNVTSSSGGNVTT